VFVAIAVKAGERSARRKLGELFLVRQMLQEKRRSSQ